MTGGRRRGTRRGPRPATANLATVLAMAAVAAAAAAAHPTEASAHDARPLSIDITEQAPELYLARLRIPPAVPSTDQPEVVWPRGCRVLDRKRLDDPSATSETSLVSCPGGLEGRSIAVRYAVYNPSLSTLFRLSELDGKTLTQVRPPDRLDWQVPREPGWRDVAAGYLELGVTHIWTGVDHLLFVAGLLILAGTPRRILLAITGFTLAHSLTLSASVLGLARLPTAPVEASIALSILVLAREIARPDPDGLAGRYPVAVSSSFGLLHGFGFAAALREVGLPSKELALGLLCFNTGVELGQILFIAALLTLAFAVRKVGAAGVPAAADVLRAAGLGHAIARGPGTGLRRAVPPRAPLPLAGYALGIMAAFWFIQRLAAF